MNRKLKKMEDELEALKLKTTNEHEQHLQKLEDTRRKLDAALKEKESAEAEEAFLKADRTVKELQDLIHFFEKQIEQFEFSSRITEEEYNKRMGAVSSVVEDAAAEFRKVASKAMQDILEAKKAYWSVGEEADSVLTLLDDASNYLQSKYRYQEFKYVNAPSKFVEDPTEWTRHIYRYTKNGTLYRIISGPETDPRNLCDAAWKACDRVKK